MEYWLCDLCGWWFPVHMYDASRWRPAERRPARHAEEDPMPEFRRHLFREFSTDLASRCVCGATSKGDYAQMWHAAGAPRLSYDGLTTCEGAAAPGAPAVPPAPTAELAC